MSAREHLAAARTALEMIQVVATEDAVQRLVAKALGALAEAQSEERAKRDADAERKRADRAAAGANRQPAQFRDSSTDVHGRPRTSGEVQVSPAPSEGVRAGGEGGGSVLEDPIEMPLSSLEGISSGEVQEGVRTSPADVRGRIVTNATDDGEMGFAVRAWCEGVAKATGRRFTLSGRAEVVKLVHALNDHCPDPKTKCEWAIERAKVFVAAKPPQLNVHKFLDWLNAGAPPSWSTPGPRPARAAALQQAPSTGRVWKVGGAAE